MTKQFAVTGMTCAACSAHVERAVSQLPGVQSAAVNLMLGRLNASYDESKVTSDQIIDAVIRAGIRRPGGRRKRPGPGQAAGRSGSADGAAAFVVRRVPGAAVLHQHGAYAGPGRCPGFSTKITWLWP